MKDKLCMTLFNVSKLISYNLSYEIGKVHNIHGMAERASQQCFLTRANLWRPLHLKGLMKLPRRPLRKILTRMSSQFVDRSIENKST